MRLAAVTVLLVSAIRSVQGISAPPTEYVGPPKVEQAVTNRAFTGISSMAVAPNGRLWATWYAGPTPGEDKNNYVVLSTSGDGGANWKEVLVVDPDGEGPLRAFDPELWIAPDGKLRLFWGQANGHNIKAGGVWCIATSQPDTENPVWSEPRQLTDGVMMCKPTVLSTGEWVLPAATWHVDNSAKMVVSSDQGRTWSIRGACNIPKSARNCDEHMFVERKDNSIWLLVRTTYGIGESISTDRGKTWPELTPSAIAHPTTRFFIRRLNSGNLLLVKHGPIDKRIGRSHLTAYISKDDGQSWEGGFMLDERGGVSYPDGQQAADGTIYITYDYSRTADRNILFATFREEDVLAGKDVSGKVQLRKVISKGSGGVAKKDNGEPQPVKNNADGVKLNVEKPGTWKCKTSHAFKTGSKLFSDRGYTISEVPAPLEKADFFVVNLDGTKTLTCDKAGMLYVLTPLPNRNKDSVSEALLKQGFQKVALTEVRLFDSKNPGNYCSLFQKNCRAGASVTFGKWGVPLFFVK